MFCWHREGDSFVSEKSIREIKQTELKGLFGSYSCTIIGGEDENECSWAQLMRLHFWKRRGGYERAPFGIGKNGNADGNILGTVPPPSRMVCWTCLLPSCEVWRSVCERVCTGVTRAVKMTGATAAAAGVQVWAKGTGSARSRLHSQNHLPVGWSNCQSQPWQTQFIRWTDNFKKKML